MCFPVSKTAMTLRSQLPGRFKTLCSLRFGSPSSRLSQVCFSVSKTAMTLQSQLPVYSHSRHADAFRAKSLSYRRRFQALVVKDDDSLLHVVAVHHRAHKRSSVFKLSPSIASPSIVQAREGVSFSVFVSTLRGNRNGTERKL